MQFNLNMNSHIRWTTKYAQEIYNKTCLPQWNRSSRGPELGILAARCELVARPGVADACNHVLADHGVHRRRRDVYCVPGLQKISRV